MKKLIWLLLLNFMLVGYGLQPTEVLAQQADDSAGVVTLGAAATTAPRYTVTYMNSQTGGTIDSATVVSVTNGGTEICDVVVNFYKGFAPGTPVCTATYLNLNPRETADFCSRSLPGQITTCNATCSPGLTSDEGKAVVYSEVESTLQCKKIAVSGRVYYNSDGDTAVQGITDSYIVKYGTANKGD